jgi:hypothetical protein
MVRPYITSISKTLVLGFFIATAAACSSGPEYQILRQYFTASRARDNVTLGNIATVSFSPAERGTVESFDVVSVSPDQTSDVQVKSLAAGVAQAQKAADEYAAKKRAFQDGNIEAIGRVIKAEAASIVLKGKDAEIQQEWTKWRSDESEFSKKLNDAKVALSGARLVPDASLTNKNVDLTQTDATLVTRDVSIKAQVKDAQGATSEKDMVVTLALARVASGPAGAPVDGKWVVTHIK